MAYSGNNPYSRPVTPSDSSVGNKPTLGAKPQSSKKEITSKQKSEPTSFLNQMTNLVKQALGPKDNKESNVPKPDFKDGRDWWRIQDIPNPVIPKILLSQQPKLTSFGSWQYQGTNGIPIYIKPGSNNSLIIQIDFGIEDPRTVTYRIEYDGRVINANEIHKVILPARTS